MKIDDLPTLPYRMNHRVLSKEEAGHFEDVHKPGTGIKEGERVRLHDTLGLLFKRHWITKEQYDAGRTFEELFDKAALEPLRAPSLERVCGNPTKDLSKSICGARKGIMAKIDRLGGIKSPASSCVWAVLGEGKTIREWASSCGFPMREEAARGVLIAALGVLAS